MASEFTRFRVVTYNVHRCRGLDRLTRVDRVAEVIGALEPDIVALQEVVGAGPRGQGQAEQIGAFLGMGWVMAPTRHFRRHLYGNVILSRWPIVHHTNYDLTWKTCESRGAQRADIDTGGATLHLYNVHLGTALRERQYQAGRLAAFVHDHRVRGPKIVLGDFNEWTRGLATTILSRTLNSVDLGRFLRRRRTYPGVFPLLHLDHIYYEGNLEVEHVTLGRGRRALVASDHLPLAADVRLTL
ncbi:MAG: Endonuclease/Exonuclease/phosphatase family protein [Acidobacteria bacterium]|jgi:endonuclease/exonuclease/phosphatase family metal-dependent hydrolase|nr:Endonuclease/Exonuclease/phosphatase family protein [Acidobacteriota bacterium]